MTETENIYFQWQNPHLRKTIYPARDMKLRHFLVYYEEIDLWKKYQDKKIANVPKERAEFEAAQKKAVTEAFRTERRFREYFQKPLTVDEIDWRGDVKKIPEFPTLWGILSAALKSEESDRFIKDEFERCTKLLVGLHDSFATYFKKFANPNDEVSQDRREKIFVAMRIAEWERFYKELRQRVARRKGITRGDDRHKEIDAFEAIVLERMRKELGKLKDFVVAQHRLEKRKAEFAKRMKENQTAKDRIYPAVQQLEKEIQSLNARKKKTQATISRLKDPPDLTELLGHYTESSLYDEIRATFSMAQPEILESVIAIVSVAIGDTTNSFYKDLKFTLTQWDQRGRKDPNWMLNWLQDQIDKWLQAQSRLDREILGLEAKMRVWVNTLRFAPLKNVSDILEDRAMADLLSREIDRLEDLWAAISFGQLKPAELKDRLAAEQKSLREIDKELQAKLTALGEKEKELEPINVALEIDRDKFLSTYTPDGEPDVRKDIVPFLAQKFHEGLESLSHDQLLHLIFERFQKQPDRFPLWLQYMVVHFSGMRYASAHGSWADPRDMLLSLRTLDLQKEYKKKWGQDQIDGKDDEEVEELCNAKIQEYQSLLDGSVDASTVSNLEPLARAMLARPKDVSQESSVKTGSLQLKVKESVTPNPVRERMEEYYLRRLASENSDVRRKTLMDLEIEEENYRIQEIKAEDVLEELKTYHDGEENDIPDWMWSEIVKMTDLRLTEVKSDNWETVSAEQWAADLAKMDSQLAKYRDILNQWKQEHLTGWRAEHDRSNRLIVTRAVCNEVAEHIQHLRGHVGGAGLTQKPFWYTGEEKKYYATKAAERKPGQRPYFVRARDKRDFEIGASLLWLRFVHDIPNEWRVARPMSTREGDGLIDSMYLGRELESGGWVYNLNEPISRTRLKNIQKGSKTGTRESQWLRWMHEATIAEVASTAEGDVVLTFETALPYEDPSLATIGVFKRFVHDLVSDQGEDAYNPTFVGFVPEGAIPAQDMEEMLDWNHILLEEVLTPNELEAYRQKYIRNHKPPRPRITMEDVNMKPEPVKALQSLKDYDAWTDELVLKNPKLFKVKRWGYVRPEELDVATVGTTNFQAVSLYNKETGFGAISNFIYIPHDEVLKLRDMQIDDEYQDRRGDWRDQKMGWLCKRRGCIYMFENPKDKWESAPRIRWGTLALGGNIVQVDGFEEFPMKNRKKPRKFARLVGFQKTDWERPLDELLAEGLVHRCFCALNGNKFADTPKGIVYSPFYSLAWWEFGGKKKPRALYLPCEDLEPKTDLLCEDQACEEYCAEIGPIGERAQDMLEEEERRKRQEEKRKKKKK